MCKIILKEKRERINGVMQSRVTIEFILENGCEGVSSRDHCYIIKLTKTSLHHQTVLNIALKREPIISKPYGFSWGSFSFLFSVIPFSLAKLNLQT